MTCLLLGAMLLIRLGVCFAEQVVLAPPAHVRFESVDYKNTVHWNASTSSSSLHYYVQWKIYGEPQWLDVSGCQGIQKLQCDMSTVTSEPREWYYARVHASDLPPNGSSWSGVHASALPTNSSAWSLSPRFSPRWDTKISPPHLKLNVTEQGIMVRVKPPRLLVRKMNSRLRYRVYLTHTGEDQKMFFMDCCSNNKLALKDLKHKTKYCVQAQMTVPMQAKSGERSDEKCVTTL